MNKDKLNLINGKTDSNFSPIITDNTTQFYFIKNENLEDNLKNYTSEILNLEINKINNSLRNKWIDQNKSYKLL